MADNIVVQLDLDTEEYTRKLSQVEKDLDRVSNSETQIKVKTSLETKQLNDEIVSISESVKTRLTKSFTSFTKLANGNIVEVSNKINQSLSSTIIETTEKLNDTNKSASQGMKKLNEGFSELSGGVGQTEKSVNGFNKSLDSTKENSNKLGSTLKALAIGGFGALTAGQFAYGVATKAASISTAEYAAKMEQFRKGFIIGSTAPAKLTQTLINLNAGFFGFTKSIGLAGISLVVLGQSLKETESQLLRVSGVITTALGVALTGLSYLIVSATKNFGELVLAIGNRGVAAFTSFTKTFSEFEKSNLIFVRTIEGFNKAYGSQIGDLDSWEKRIRSISESTGISSIQLRTAVAELVAAGSQFNLSEGDLNKLLNVIVDYSSVTGDVTQTTIDFVSALQGSSQSVLKYGIKVNEAAIQQALIEKGVKRSIASLTEQDLMYLRLSKIMKVHGVIEGKAVAVSKTLSGQQQVLSTALERVNTEIGFGASYIENYNLLALAANTVLTNLNNTFLNTVGFIGALGSRILQIIGVMLKWSFTVYGLIAAFQLLDFAMKSNLVQTAMGKSIPFLNKSFIDLIKSTGVATVNMNSASGAIKTFAMITVESFKKLIAMSLGVEASTLTIGVALRALATKSISVVTIAARGLWTAFAALATNPFVLVAAAISGVIYGIYRAMVFLENKTGVLAASWTVLKNLFSEGASVFSPFIKLLDSVSEAAIRVAAIFAGMFVDKIAGAFQFIASVVKSNPFKIFSDDSVKAMDEASVRIQSLRLGLQQAGFDIRKVSGDIDRIPMMSAMGLSPEAGKEDKVIKDKIKSIELYKERIFNLGEVNRGFWENQSILTQKFAADSAIALDTSSADFQRVAKVIVEKNEELAMSARTNLAEGVGDSLAAMGAAFVTAGQNGESGLAALGKGLMSTLGDIFTMIGKQLIAVGLGMSLVPMIFGMQGTMAVIAGGMMMVAGGVLKGVAGKGGAVGGAASAPNPSEASPQSGSTSIPSPLTNFQDIENAEPMTNVTINVSGVVTDPRGTAKQISNILKDGFKSSAIAMRTV